MSFDGFDDEFHWNEHQWESHLNELENRSAQLRKFITSDPKGNLPRWITLLQENLDEDEAVDAFIEEELLLDEAYFPEEDDDWEEDEDDFEEDDFFLRDEDFLFMDEDEDDYDAGEEWKSLSDDFLFSDYGSLDDLDIYNVARNLAVDILKWAESVLPQEHTKTYHDFVGNILKIGAKLAGGYSFGFEQDYLGGNIAYNKKALYCANDALQQMQKLRKAPYMTEDAYKHLHGRLFELRNDIGIYIQELRNRFYFGLE